MSFVILKMSATLIALITFLLTVSVLGKRYRWQPEVQRKTLHIALGSSALSFPWLFDQCWQVVTICAVGALILLTVRTVPFVHQRLGRCLHDVKRTSFGELYFAVVIPLLFVLSQTERPLYVVPLAILTFADSSAALVGKRWGRHRFAVLDGQKSWEGVAAFAVIAFVVTIGVLSWLTTLSWLSILLLATTLAIFTALIETVAWHGLDNLLIPLGGYVCLELLGQWNEVMLLCQLALLGGLLGLASSRQSRLSPHTLLLWALSVYCLLLGGALLWFLALLCVLLCLYFWRKFWSAWGSDAMDLPAGQMWLLSSIL